jgi:hypothetical protein
MVNGDPLALPAVAVPVMLDIVGWGATVKAMELVEATPSAVTTVIAAGPAVVRLVIGTVAVQEVVGVQVLVPAICVLVPELNAQKTWDPALILLPVIFTATGCWVSLVATSVRGLEIVGGAATVNAEEPEATPSAVTTVIAAEPAVVRLAGGMVAVQEVVSPQVFVPVISVAVPELNDQ